MISLQSWAGAYRCYVECDDSETGFTRTATEPSIL